ncbi:MAG: hypothetical protein IPP49_04440 [Saprospiraceae bacterium]|nr:hypothetical protein [Saprospiraceae bacterium]
MRLFSNIRIWMALAFVVAVGQAYAQSPSRKQYIVEAEKQYADKNFYGALIYYNEALEFDPKDPEILFKSAESARQFNAYSKAAAKYQFLIDSLNDTTQPLAIYWLALVNQRMGKYDEARKYYDLYISEFGGIDSLFTAKAKKEIASVDFARNMTAYTKKNVKFEKLGEDINSTASEVAGNFVNNEFYFSSMKYSENNPLSLPAREISKILKKSKDSIVAPLTGYINERDLLVSNSAINTDGTMMYYTVCQYINGSDIRCEMYKSNVDKNGILSNEVKLLDPINLPGTTSTHPHITKDKVSGKEILYFVSDRKGGAGGLDIWYSLIDPKFGFSEPINIAEINTSDNEITPFYNQTSDFLFFSSDGREGLGGYDVYKTGKTNEAFGSVIGAGMPFNSSYNDIYYFEKS